MTDLAALETSALAALEASKDEAALRAWNTRYFGDNGEVKQALRGIGAIPQEQKRAYGQQANQVRATLEAAYDAAPDQSLWRETAKEVRVVLETRLGLAAKK